MHCKQNINAMYFKGNSHLKTLQKITLFIFDFPLFVMT